MHDKFMKKEYLNMKGDEISVDDWVVFTYGHRSYYNVEVGVVVGFTKHLVKVKTKCGTTNRDPHVLYDYHDFLETSLTTLENL